MHKQRHNLAHTDLEFTLLFQPGRQSERGKNQRSDKAPDRSNKEGGREERRKEGRRSVSWRDVVSRIW